jgi:hypothetical protein
MTIIKITLRIKNQGRKVNREVVHSMRENRYQLKKIN